MNYLSSPDAFSALQGKRILIVEDESLIAMMVEDELLTAGAVVLSPTYSVQDSLQALKGALADGGLSAAVLDIKLENESTLEVADALAEHGIPFIFATGYGEHFDKGRHERAPVLTKPYDPGQLRAALESLVAAGA